jgi:hypothetical protein
LAVVALTVAACAEVGTSDTSAPAALTRESTEEPDLYHRGDFLTNPGCPPFTTGYPNAPRDVRASCRAAISARGYTHHYVSIVSSQRNWFADLPGFQARLRELRDAGIQPVVFLTSDTGGWKDQQFAAIAYDLARFIPHVDSLVSSYALGIEIDEYWEPGMARAVGEQLRRLTNKRIAAHQLQGRWSYCEGEGWCDYMILQYGFELDEEEIRSMTRSASLALGKPVVAGEYAIDVRESVSRRLGDAAVAAGAAGFGNGGSPAAPLGSEGMLLVPPARSRALRLSAIRPRNAGRTRTRAPMTRPGAVFPPRAISGSLDGRVLRACRELQPGVCRRPSRTSPASGL